MLFNFFFLISNLLLLFILIKIQNKYKFILDNNGKSFHKTHEGSTPLTGGLLIIINIIILQFLANINLTIISIIILLFFFLIGVLSDIYEDFKPMSRLILQFSLIFLFIYSHEIILKSIDISLIDFFLKNKIINILFLSFCTVVLINGLNLLDGKNGLVSINLLIVLFILYFINLKNNELGLIYIFLSIILIVFLIYNLYGQCFLGDSGVYVIGFLISYLTIETYNKSSMVSSIFIVNLLWLPSLENLFSIVRRFLLNKIDITSPDKRHLHHLIDIYLVKKLKLKKNLSSPVTGIIINFYYLITIILAYNFMWSRSINVFILLLNLLVYIFVYIKLLNMIYKTK